MACLNKGESGEPRHREEIISSPALYALQCFQRRRRGLGERSVASRHRGQRNPPTLLLPLPGHLVQRMQQGLLCDPPAPTLLLEECRPSGSPLPVDLSYNRLPVAIKPQAKTAALRDPLRNLPVPPVGVKPCIGPGWSIKRILLLHSFVCDHAKEGRLLKLHRQALAQRTVKHRIAG